MSTASPWPLAEKAVKMTQNGTGIIQHNSRGFLEETWDRVCLGGGGECINDLAFDLYQAKTGFLSHSADRSYDRVQSVEGNGTPLQHGT